MSNLKFLFFDALKGSIFVFALCFLTLGNAKAQQVSSSETKPATVTAKQIEQWQSQHDALLIKVKDGTATSEEVVLMNELEQKIKIEKAKLVAVTIPNTSGTKNTNASSAEEEGKKMALPVELK